MCALIQTCALIHTQTAYAHPKEKEEKEKEEGAGELGEREGGGGGGNLFKGHLPAFGEIHILLISI